ncbi:MAG TPA: helix-turn-helix transcriptional regulator [Gemmatimonadales bacterium]|nr:helix-turn-helix transcriptional regulator [Gemmatimonadales bacterium]
MRTFVADSDVNAQAPCLADDVTSPREREIVLLVAPGYRNAEVAAQLGISQRTVVTHLHNIFRKTGVRNRRELIGYARRVGIV